MNTPFPVRSRERLCGPSRRRGFTLIELLTVVAILLATIGGMRETSRAASCMANLRQLGAGILLFTTENRGTLPGSGKVTPTASASWQDVINARVFGAQLGSNTTILQRQGDTPRSGQMYCPSMQPFGTETRYPRAYVMNGNTIDANENTNPKGDWGNLLDYQPGRRLAEFATPARTVLILESERNGDRVTQSAPLNSIVMETDGGTNPPWSANGGNFAFRHKGRMNVLFLDGHVVSMDQDAAALMNRAASFTTTGL